MALQDSKNVDTNCILQNNDKFIGCNGDFNKYQFSENRSVASCNGLIGGLDRRDCFYYGSGYYYSSRAWAADSIYFREQTGKYYKSDWHHVEAYFKMNNITNGKGIPDGQIRYWYDSELLISYDNILFRTAQFPDMKFNQFLIAPYTGDGSPIEQTMWIDDLTVATSRLSTDVLEENINGLILSPNPAGDFIEINVGARHAVPLPEQLEIFNIFGEKESTSVNFVDTSASGGHLRIDISNLAPGVYFIKIGDKFEKFVKM